MGWEMVGTRPRTRSTPSWLDAGGHDGHRLLPATRIQCLRDLLDNDARRRGDGNSYRLLDLTVYWRQETWEDSPTGRPERLKGKQVTRTDVTSHRTVVSSEGRLLDDGGIPMEELRWKYKRCEVLID